MPNKFWVGGTATWDSTAGSKWATTSGGAGGAAAPTAADDVFFDNRNAPNWAASTAHALGVIRSPLATANGFFYEVTTAGTSGATEPTWPTTVGNTVLDGTITWTCRLATVTTAGGATCLTANFTNFIGTFNAATGWTIATSLTFSSGMTITGTGTISKTTSGGTWTFNGQTYTGSWSYPIGGGFTTTIGDNLVFAGSITGGVSSVLTASSARTISVGTNLSWGGNVNLTNVTFIMSGTGTITGSFIGVSGVHGLTINSPVGTITHSAVISISSTTFTFTTAGNWISTAAIQFGGTTTSIVNNVASITFGSMAFLSSGGQNVTLNSDMYVTGALGGSGVAGSINGTGRLYIGGNISGVPLLGTSTIEMYGSSPATLSASSIGNSLTINKSGGASVTLSGTITWGAAGRILQRTAGNINAGTSTVTIPNASVIINNMVFNNLTITSGATITQNTLNTINSTLLLSGNATFTGTAGWNTNNFTHGGAGFTCTLQAGITYNVTGLFAMIGTSTSRAVLQSNDVQNVQVTINALSDQMVLNTGTIPNPSTGYVLGSRAFTDVLPAVLNALLPDRPTILSGTANPYTLTAPIGGTAVPSSLLLQLGKKAFFNVTAGTGSTFVAYAATRDIDSSGGIEIQAAQSYSDAIGQPSANLFRTINWRPLIAPSSSTYYTWIK